MSTSQVLVQVIETETAAGREISYGRNVVDSLDARLGDIQRAIVDGSKSVAGSLGSLASPEGWSLGEVSASFGITLVGEAGVIVSKVSAGATFEVQVKFTRKGS